MADLIEANPQAVAVYDYEDLKDGFGLVTYYLSDYKDTGGTDYVMGKLLNYSSDVAISMQEEGKQATATYTYTFYSGSFSRPRVLEGNCYFNFCCKGYANGGTGYSFQLKLYHYDGTTSTQLGSTWQSASFTVAAFNHITQNMNSIIVPTSSQKFKKGDQIKLELLITHNYGGSNDLQVGIDPQNRDSEIGDANDKIKPSAESKATTQFICNIPFKVGAA